MDINEFLEKHHKKLLIIALVVTIISIIIGIVAIVLYNMDSNLYENADKQEAMAKDMANAAVIDISSVMDTSKKESVKEGEPQDIQDISLTADYMYKRIDFSKLEDVNKDEVAGWLYVPDTTIDYVVMKGNASEPYKYLWKDPLGNKSKTGSLFIRYEEASELPDAHTIIYGHRLQDHSLYFGALLKYHELSYARDHSVAYFYTPNEVIKYSLYSVNDGHETDPVYLYPFAVGTAEYEWMIGECNTTQTFKISNEDKFNSFRNMLVLSTCSGKKSNQPERLYLIFMEEERVSY